MPVTAGIIGGGLLVGGVAGAIGSGQQAGAAKDAAATNAELIRQQMDAQQQAGYTANNLLFDAYPKVQDWMRQGYDANADFATQGLGQQRQDILGGGNNAAGAINQGQGLSLGQLYAGTGQGVDYLNSGLQSGVGAIGGRTDRSGAMLDQQGGLYGNLQMDPGYDFRRGQGEEAIRNMQAAQGGRMGGAAMKALVDYNQNFASNEYNNASQRRLESFNAAQGTDAQSLNAQQSVAQMYAGAGSQAGQMAYGMGQQGAGIIGGNANSLANIYAQTGTQLGAQSGMAGQVLGQMSQDYYGGMGNLDWNLAQQMGQNVMGAAGAGAQLVPSAIANNQSTVDYAGSGAAAVGNMAHDATTLAAILGLAGRGSGGPATGSGPAQNGPGLSVPLNRGGGYI